MEIKGGEYVRTNDGSIYQLEDLEDPIFLSDKFYNKIVKHSRNIIDLIECSDYVNGKEVVYDADASGMYNGHKTIGVSISNDNSTTWTILDTEIRDIVTKQQFNQMKYIVGDESNVKD